MTVKNVFIEVLTVIIPLMKNSLTIYCKNRSIHILKTSLDIGVKW